MSNIRRELEAYIRMRLKGQNDITFRAYDIEYEGEKTKLLWAYKWPRLIFNHPKTPEAECDMAALKMQRDLLDEGFGVVPIVAIHILVKQFWPYYRIKTHHRKGKKRTPEESHNLYMEHLKSLSDEATSKASPVPS